MKKIYRATLILLLSLYGISACNASENHWISILGTFTSPSSALKSIKKLSTDGEEINLISSNDCENIKPNFIIAIAGIFTDKKTAQKKVNHWKTKKVKDAYIKVCKLKQNSRLALNIPLIDASFQQLETDPINWEVKEALSSIKPIAKNQFVVIKPYYIKDAEDIREGLRQQIVLRSTNNTKPIILSKDCVDPDFFNSRNFIGFSCAKEVAAMNLLHEAYIFSRKSGERLKSVKHCRSAKIVNQQLECLKETVNNEGELQLTKIKISLQ